MNANKQDAGGLPELPKEAAGYMRGCNIDLQEGDLLFTADQMRAYGELCRAAPAGGDAEVVRLRQLLAASEEQFRAVSDILERNQARIERVMKMLDSAPAGSGEVDGWLLDGCLIYRLSDGLNQTNTHEINVTMWDGSREFAVRDKAAAALLRKLQQGADKPLTADMAKALPGGTIDDTTFDQIEHALDRAGAPACDESGKWLTLSQRIAALASQGQEGGKNG